MENSFAFSLSLVQAWNEIKMKYTAQVEIVSRGYDVYKNVNWENIEAGGKLTTEIEANKGSIKIDLYCCAAKAMEILLNWPLSVIFPGKFQGMSTFSWEKKMEKWRVLFFPKKYRPSPIPAGVLEKHLMLSLKSLRYLTHQKIKNVLAQLSSWDFEANNDDEAEVPEEEAMKIITEEDKDSAVVKPKKKRNPRQIHNSDEEDVEEDYSKVINLKTKRMPPLIEDSEIELGIIVEK